ncbi:MAG: phenylalanine--tRNA ligase subunit beta [Culicoidibacterales bacterium]
MYLSRKWLSEFLDVNVSSKELADKMSISGLEVEGYESLIQVQGLKAGKVIALEKHPEADKLNVCQVDVGSEVLQIVCGAANVHLDAYVIVAPIGTKLPEIEIKAAKLRGVDSNGMLCSLQELGLDEKFVAEKYKSGIYLFDEPVELGGNPIELLQLDDEVLDISITPNRADALSMFGLAYEVGALYNQKPNFPEVSMYTEGKWFDVKLETETCPVYYAGKASNVVIKESPMWMQAYLIANNIRPISNVVDITNYVMLETGQPLHAFDFETLQGGITVRNAREGEVLVTLDEKERKLETTDTVITDERGPIALAGVMGGMETEVTDQTKTILLESAYFKDVAIRKTANKFNLRSESSLRFEKIADPAMTLFALKRALDLLEKYADATIERSYVKVGNIATEGKQIAITTQFISKKIGVEFQTSEIVDILAKLQLETVVNGDELMVHVPTRRQEITIKEDIVEEVARIYGLENIQGVLPHLSSQVGELSSLQKVKRTSKQLLEAAGYQEFVSYSLVDEKSKELVMIPDLEKKKGYQLMSPLSEERAYFRKSTVASLLEVVNYNVSRRQLDVFGYEIAQIHTFETNENSVDVETVLSIVGSGKVISQTPKTQAKNVDYYDLQEQIIRLLNQFQLFDVRFKAVDSKVLQPGIAAEIIVNDDVVGTLGKVDPRVAVQHNVKQAVFVAEFSLTKLVREIEKDSSIQYIPVTKFPEIERDLAFVIKRDIEVANLVQTIKTAAQSITLKNVVVFDIYEGERIASDEKSISIRLHFSDSIETMTTEQIDEIVERIITQVETTFNTIFRR